MLQCVIGLCSRHRTQLRSCWESNLQEVLSRYEQCVSSVRSVLPQNDNASHQEIASRPLPPLEWSAIPIAVFAAACARDVVPAQLPESTPVCGLAITATTRLEANPPTWSETSCALDGASVRIRFVDDATSTPLVLSGRRDGDALQDLAFEGPSAPATDRCDVTFGAAGTEVWGAVRSASDPNLDLRFHACDCTGWTANESHGAVRVSFEHAEPIAFESDRARCAVDGARVRMRIDGGTGEQWALSGTIGRGSLVDGNLALVTPSIGSITQNIPLCSATFALVDDVARGHVHCAVCGTHGVFDSDFEIGCDVVHR